MQEFNGDQVIRHFNLPAEYDIERAAMSFMFRTMREATPPKSADDLKNIAEYTIEKIEMRYALFREFVEDFFQGPYDGKALVTAVICGEYVNHINDPYPDEYTRTEDIIDEPVKFRNDGIDELIVIRACNIWDDATMLHQNGMPKDKEDLPCREAVFLAHLNIFQHIHEITLRLMGEQGEELDDEELYTIISSDIPKGRAVLDLDTQLGQHVSKYFDYLEQELRPHVRHLVNEQTPETGLVRPRPALRLVPKMDGPA